MSQSRQLAAIMPACRQAGLWRKPSGYEKTKTIESIVRITTNIFSIFTVCKLRF